MKVFSTHRAQTLTQSRVVFDMGSRGSQRWLLLRFNTTWGVFLLQFAWSYIDRTQSQAEIAKNIPKKHTDFYAKTLKFLPVLIAVDIVRTQERFPSSGHKTKQMPAIFRVHLRISIHNPKVSTATVRKKNGEKFIRFGNPTRILCTMRPRAVCPAKSSARVWDNGMARRCTRAHGRNRPLNNRVINVQHHVGPSPATLRMIHVILARREPAYILLYTISIWGLLYAKPGHTNRVRHSINAFRLTGRSCGEVGLKVSILRKSRQCIPQVEWHPKSTPAVDLHSPSVAIV